MCNDVIVKVAFIEYLIYVDHFVDKPSIFRMVEMLMVVDFGCFCKTNQRERMNVVMAIRLLLFV